MIRRDFFKAITAAGAALAAGRTAIASISPPAVDLTPRLSVATAIKAHEKAKNYALSLLNKCAVTSFSRTRVGNAFVWEVEYTYDRYCYYAANLNDELAKIMPAVAEPRSIEVVTEYHNIDVSHLGWTENVRLEAPRHRIIVTWVTP